MINSYDGLSALNQEMPKQSSLNSRILLRGWGSALPAKCFTNSQLAAHYNLDTSNDWIVQRTGIEQRYIADGSLPELTSGLGTRALQQALERAKLTAADLDGIIVATTSPDNIFPAVAVRIQANIGMTQGFAFDLQAVCSGFIYAIHVARSMLLSGQVKRIAIVGAENISRLVDWTDRTTAVLFGDGAGAFILEAANQAVDILDEEKNKKNRGFFSSYIYSVANLYDILKVSEENSKICMDGKEVFRYGIEHMTAIIQDMLRLNGLTVSDIDWILPHQANIRMLQGIADRLGMPQNKVMCVIDKLGNTSAASIPLAWDIYASQGLIQPGQRIAMVSAGGGMTFGGALFDF